VPYASFSNLLLEYIKDTPYL